MARLINKIFGIPAIIYIDDTIIVCRPELQDIYEEIVTRFYTKLGFWVSLGKTETMSKELIVQVLGMNYKVSGLTIQI